MNSDVNVKILGIGHAGINIVNALSQLAESAWLKIAAVDTDKLFINNKEITVPIKFLIGEEWTDGLGCGGNIIKGERAIAHKSNIQLKEFISDASLLITVGGFGGGTATGGMPVILRMAKEKNIPTLTVVTIPFAFEGHSKRDIAEKQISQILKTSNTIIPIPNDLLYDSMPSSASFEAAFTKANTEVALSVLGLAELLRCTNLIPIDLCDLHNAVSKAKSFCSVGTGISDGNDESLPRTHSALQKALESPLLGGIQKIKNADALIISLTGDSNLTIGEVKHTLNNITKLANVNTEMVVGANSDLLYQNKVQITILSIKYEESLQESTQVDTIPKIQDKKSISNIIKDIKFLTKSEKQQQELPFINQTRGYFSNTSPSIYYGIDIDIPTFQRENKTIDNITKL